MNRFVGLLASLLWMLVIPGWAQNRVLVGIVLDQVTQQPVPFATLGVPQQPLGTAANEAGAFRLVLPATA
ncbi:MAG: hypothetical protein EOO63_13625, partial [Hymenobacter sp.]